MLPLLVLVRLQRHRQSGASAIVNSWLPRARPARSLLRLDALSSYANHHIVRDYPVDCCGVCFGSTRITCAATRQPGFGFDSTTRCPTAVPCLTVRGQQPFDLVSGVGTAWWRRASASRRNSLMLLRLEAEVPRREWDVYCGMVGVAVDCLVLRGMYRHSLSKVALFYGREGKCAVISCRDRGGPWHNPPLSFPLNPRWASS